MKNNIIFKYDIFMYNKMIAFDYLQDILLDTWHRSLTFIFLKFNRIRDEDLLYTDWGWNFDPMGLRYGLRQLMDRYGKIPVVITECGWSEKEELEDGEECSQGLYWHLWTHCSHDYLYKSCTRSSQQDH